MMIAYDIAALNSHIETYNLFYIGLIYKRIYGKKVIDIFAIQDVCKDVYDAIILIRRPF